MNYVETDCTIQHEGRTFEAGGAVVTPEYAIGYLMSCAAKGDREHSGAFGHVTNWVGKQLGTFRIVSVWSTPQSFVSSIMCQVEATIDGVVYTGRSAGYGMIWKGKRKAAQPKPEGVCNV